MLILAASMALAAYPADADPKARFKECIKHVNMLDPSSDGLTKCLRAEQAATPPLEEQNVDPIAKKAADDQASKYSLLLTAEKDDPTARCIQAGVTAWAYLDAGMMSQYDRWKAIEDRDCKAATGS